MSGPLGTSGGGAAGVTSVTAGNGITVTGTTTPTIAASLAAGTGIGISGTTTLSISNSGVTALAGSTGISVSAATGSVTVTPTYAAPTALTIGGTVVTGAAASVANSAHVHAMPGSAVAGASAVGDTAATGSATTVALSDHRHSREAFAVAGASAVGDTAATGTATTISRSDHKHGREAFGTPIAVTGGATAASGSATTISRSDHVHSTASMPALLASTTLGSAAASVTFSSISGAFSILDIICVCRSATAAVYDQIFIQFNNDTGANYKISTVTGLAYIPAGYINGATAIGGLYFANPRLQIYAYSDANWYATTNGQHFTGSSATEYTAASYQAGGVWSNTATVTSVKLYLQSASNFVANSTFRLYGIP